MLILTRKPGEAIVIGDKTINLTVLGVRGKQVKLGIEAPSCLSVNRKEIYDAKQKAQQSLQGEKISA